MNPAQNNINIWYTAIAGTCALFVGIGLCRFAYAPMIPAMIDQNWVSQAGAGYLGAINLFGYLLGAYLCKQINKHFERHIIIKASLVISMAGLGFCAIDLGFTWLALWRFVTGITGALLMIMTPSLVLKHVPVQYKGRVAGIVFMGIGLGIILSGSLFPALAKLDVSFAWLGAAALVLFATFIAWRAFPKTLSVNESSQSEAKTITEKEWTDYPQIALMLLGIAYMAYGIGMVPHGLFLVDYVHTQLDLTLVASGVFWSLLGIGAAIGPLCVGILVDKMGLYRSLVLTFFAAVFSILLLVVYHSPMFYAISAFLMGVLLSAIPSLVSSRVLDLVGVVRHPVYWGRVVLYCAISQALAAHIMSYFIANGIPYVTCFAIASLVFAFGCVAVVLARVPESEQAAI